VTKHELMRVNVRRFLLVFMLLAMPSPGAWGTFQGVVESGETWRYSNLPPQGREQLLIDEDRVLAGRKAQLRQEFTEEEMIAMISDVALRYGIEPSLLCAIAFTESRFLPYVVSPMGAQGLMQLMPMAVQKFGVEDRLNPIESAEGGARLLRYLLAEYDNDLVLALAAYNAGPSVVKKGGKIPPYSETMCFVQTVLAYHEEFRKKEP